MIPFFESPKTINEAIFIMASISPKVQSSLELESYRLLADSDESTEKFILEDTFSNFIKDLEEIGLKFKGDISIYTEEMESLSSFIRISTLLLPSSLYQILRNNQKIRDLVERIVKGDLGDNTTYIETYLSELGGLDGHTAIESDLTDFIDQMYPLISQTEVFSDYFKNMIKLINEEKLMNESDHDMHTQYTDKMKYLIGRLSDATNQFENDPRYNVIASLQKLVIREFLAPCNFHEYSYLFLNTEETLPKDLIPNFRRKWYHFYISGPWGIEYYHYRQIPISPDSGVWPFLYCFLYAMNDTKELFRMNKSDLFQAYPNKSDESVIMNLYER